MSDSIGSFVNKVITDIQNNLPNDFELSDSLLFEVSVVSESSKKGGLNFRIASADANAKNQFVQKVRFSVNNPKKQGEKALNTIQILKSGATAIVGALNELGGEEIKPTKKLKGKKSGVTKISEPKQ